MTTRCHSVRSRRSPEFLSRQVSEVATERLTTGIARIEPTDLGIGAQIADQNYLVHAASFAARANTI
jgi:hypothetical protein